MRFIPPATQNRELNQFLVELSNYVSNIAVPDSSIANPLTDPVVYTERYLHVKFAINKVGGGVSDSPTNKTYFGLFNSATSVELLLYYEYQWYAASFGATGKLWYKNLGNRSIQFATSTTAPDSGFSQVLGPAIDLDAISVNIPDYSLTNVKFADNSVDSRVLADNAVEKANVANGAIGVAELETTGTPASNRYLNGLMQWAEINPGLFLAQHLLTTHEYVAAAYSGGQMYHARAQGSTIVVSIPPASVESLPIGTTYVFINMDLDVTIRADEGTIVLAGSGDEGTAFLVGQFGKGTLTKIESDLWMLDGDNLTLTADLGPYPADGDFIFLGTAYTPSSDFAF